MNINNNMYPDKIPNILSICHSETSNNGYNTGYEKLGDAIVEQALRDYYYTLRRLKKNPHDYKLKKQLHELLDFFNSSYCELLASFDVEQIMRKLEKRV